MLKRIAVVLSTIGFATFVLIISIFHSCRIEVFSASPRPAPTAATAEIANEPVEYFFAYPGSVLPDSPFWYLKAGRDRLWLWVTSDVMRKAELSLLFADKRLVASYELFKKDKPSLAVSTLTKAEKYLQSASLKEMAQRQKGGDTKSFLLTLTKASISHMQKMEEILTIAPDDIKPEVVKAKDYAIQVYLTSKIALEAQGINAPKNPFLKN